MTKKDIAFKLVKWATWNGIFAYSVYAGVVMNNKGWANVATAIIAFMGVIGVMLFLASSNKQVLKSYVENNQRVVPLWFDGYFDVLIAGVLVYHSWFWSAGLLLFSMAAVRLIDSNAKEYTLESLKS